MKPAPNPTVLVVEDDPELRPLIVESLEASGFTAAEACDSADARARLEGFAYDCLVVDLGLPDGDGMQVLRDALQRYPALRAVVVTGEGSAFCAGGDLSWLGESSDLTVTRIRDRMLPFYRAWLTIRDL